MDWISDVFSSYLAHRRVFLAALRGLGLALGGLDLLLDLRRALQRGLLGLPHFLQVVVLALERLDRGFKIRQALTGFGVLLLLQRLALDLELVQPSLLAVEFLRLGVDLHSTAGSEEIRVGRTCVSTCRFRWWS